MAWKASLGDIGGAMACMTKVDQLLQMNENADPVLHLITGRVCFCCFLQVYHKQLLSFKSVVLQQISTVCLGLFGNFNASQSFLMLLTVYQYCLFQLYYAAQNKELAKVSFQKAAESIPDYAAPMFYLALVLLSF